MWCDVPRVRLTCTTIAARVWHCQCICFLFIILWRVDNANRATTHYLFIHFFFVRSLAHLETSMRYESARQSARLLCGATKLFVLWLYIFNLKLTHSQRAHDAGDGEMEMEMELISSLWAGSTAIGEQLWSPLFGQSKCSGAYPLLMRWYTWFYVLNLTELSIFELIQLRERYLLVATVKNDKTRFTRF